MKMENRRQEDVSAFTNRSEASCDNSKTILTSRPGLPKIAVIELSTKAVKFLLGDAYNIRKNGFHFDYFYRLSDLTNTGRMLDENSCINRELFEKNVIPSINRMKEIARSKRVNIIYTVATAAYRSARNKEEIIECIRNQCGLNVKILSEQEEAKATYNAFMFSNHRYTKAMKRNIILIDQGGGSTEVSLFNSKEFIKTYSLSLGTTVLQNAFFSSMSDSTDLSIAFKEIDRIIKDKLEDFFLNFNAEEIEQFCVGVGTAITTATGRIGNKHHHGVRLTYVDILNKIQETEKLLAEKYRNVYNVKRELISADYKGNAEKLLATRLGLLFYIEVMKRFNISEVVVSGTGLWYGIYYQKLKELK
jgi:exopolyphosphatase/pppGpp-phosphohydrolase